MKDTERLFSLRATEVADLDPYNVRGKASQDQARELLMPDSMQSKENQIESYFNKEQRKILEINGYTIFSLQGKTVEDIIAEGLPVVYRYNSPVSGEILGIRSVKGEVAANLDFKDFFLPNSSRKSYFQQSGMVHAYENEKIIPMELRGIHAFIGNVAEYLEIALLEPELFGEKYSYNYTITETKILNGNQVLSLGSKDGLGIHLVSSDLNYDRGDIIFAAPLIEPFTGKRS